MNRIVTAMITRTKLAAGVALGIAAGAALAVGVVHVSDSKVAAQIPPMDTSEVPRAVPAAGQVALSFAPVVKAAAPAVVNIYTATVDRRPRNFNEEFMQRFFGGAPVQPRVSQSLGSGVIVGADGLIITNNHVVEGADQILVSLADRREFKAKVLFADPRLDLALLKVETEGAALPVIRMADSDRVEVGDVTVAIGNPFGVGQTVTTGIVSAVARTGIGVSDWQFFIQTDAAINPGNSGGALLDAQGRLIGVPTAIFSRSGGSNGIGFAIPSKMVRVFLNAADKGKLVSGWIGVEGEPLTADTARQLGLDRPGGLLVTAVVPGSPGARAGIAVGDVLKSVDGKEVANGGQLRYSLATEGVGKALAVRIWRDRAERTVNVTLAAPPENPPRSLTKLSGRSILTGVTLGNLSPAYAQELGAGLPEQGVVVVAIDANAPAARFLRPGALIETLGGQPVKSVADAVKLSDAGALIVRFAVGEQRAECGVNNLGGLSCRS
ncbi:serine protease [Sandarakinorhabdus cyanobacteriorum]|uniref:Serine protease n=1 Tax=Sandarakinorhabdus cyanobacteriorum TaxID=1981098 RepID=A0A255Z3K8_9SPHN|nr:Do family serine endopeptidase [Sandarakinorhabdus cyanobacteriorum]OYQ36103.1 serine protease [Sandarakinorhabdus cyanobacteriorum]